MTLYKNADDLVQKYGERSANGEHKLGMERERGYVEIFDDFVYSGTFEVSSPWVLNSDSTSDPAVSAAVGGRLAMATSTTSENASHFAGLAPTTAANGGLVFEAKLHLAAITTIAVTAGFTDVSSEEEAFSVSGTTVTSTATDAVAFCFDTDMTTPEWWCLAVDTDVEATGNGAAYSGALTANRVPVAATDQILRIEVDKDGVGAKFFINGQKVGETTANTVTAATSIYPFINCVTRTGSAATVNVDYIYVGYNR